MSRFDELVAELCPTGVPLKALGEIGSIVRGKRFVKADMIDAGVPCIHYGEIYTKYGVAATDSFSFVSHERARSLRFAVPGDVILASAGETIKDIGKSVAWLGASPIAIHDACYAFSSPLNPKFVSYFFASRAFRDQIRQQISSSKISSISTQAISRARIPVPPRAIQHEIVRVLDQFTQLDAELEAELEARRLQYAHFRDQLVSKQSFAQAQWRPLSAVTSIRTGMKPATTSGHGEFAYINAGNEPSGYLDSFNREGGTVTIPSRGQGSAGHVSFQSDRFWCGPLCYEVRSQSSGLMDRFLYHFLRNIQDELVLLRKVGSIPAVNKGDLGKVLVPIAKIEDQRHIVEILDHFDTLVNDRSIGLPAELAARRKQYEYYRDKLLTFEQDSA
ncbi:restriction endonuclease subunit S [Microbacterium sp. NPDC097977]|uniref:restriction endonuclease subunit S n=1 Tax=Microbacterium sp. NPDC097977 TaxID=3155686 RepID=UPI003319058F